MEVYTIRRGNQIGHRLYPFDLPLNASGNADEAHDPRKPLFSIHIPKCAGSSFSEVLKTWFGRGYRRHYPDEKRNKPPKKHNLYTGLFTKRLRPNLRIHGHFNNQRGNGIDDYYPEADQFITILRDPFDLHLSTYFFVKREAKTKSSGAFRAGKPHPIIANNWNLEDYLGANPKSYIGLFLPSNLTLDTYQHILETQFLFIGVTERLQESVDRLAQTLGFPGRQVPEINVSQWTEPIPDGARDEFIRNNPLEMAIYAYARDAFS